MTIVRVKAGDNTTFTSTLTSGGVAVNLTGSTVRFLLRLVESPGTAYSFSATIVSAVAGTVSYVSDGNFPTVAGKYRHEWEVTTSGGAITTYPNDDYNFVIVLEAVDLYPTLERTVDDSGGAEAYNAFPWPDVLDDNSIVTGWKRSATHSDAGPFMLARSVNGGRSWSKRQLTVGGVAIDCAALTLKKVGDYVIVSYQDDILYTSVKFARVLASELESDFTNADFTSCGTVSFLANYSSSPFGHALTMPSGKLYQPYYSIGIELNAGKCISGLIGSTDGGETWEIGPTIATEATANPSYPQIISETWVEIIVAGATDATTKLVAYARNETVSYYSHYHSDDGGDTWTPDTVNFFYEFGVQVTRSPVAVKLHNGLVYIINGRRNASLVYTLEYVTCTPANARINSQAGYSEPNTVIDYTANSTSNGAAIDWGYAVPFVRDGELWCQFYDTSPTQDGGDRNCIVYQIKLA